MKLIKIHWTILQTPIQFLTPMENAKRSKVVKDAIQMLPTEIWMLIMKYVPYLSMWSALRKTNKETMRMMEDGDLIRITHWIWKLSSTHIQIITYTDGVELIRFPKILSKNIKTLTTNFESTSLNALVVCNCIRDCELELLRYHPLIDQNNCEYVKIEKLLQGRIKNFEWHVMPPCAELICTERWEVTGVIKIWLEYKSTIMSVSMDNGYIQCDTLILNHLPYISSEYSGLMWRFDHETMLSGIRIRPKVLIRCRAIVWLHPENFNFRHAFDLFGAGDLKYSAIDLHSLKEIIIKGGKDSIDIKTPINGRFKNSRDISTEPQQQKRFIPDLMDKLNIPIIELTEEHKRKYSL